MRPSSDSRPPERICDEPTGWSVQPDPLSLDRCALPLLVISRNATASARPHGKIPGVRLVETLQAVGAFSLLDVPSYFYERSLFGRFAVLGRYAGAALELARLRGEEVFFYNLPISYLPLYFVAALTRFRRPSLFLADGVSCFGMRGRVSLFFRWFRRIISLPWNDEIRLRAAASGEVLWFPGCALASVPRRRAVRQPPTVVTLLFNSALLPHNSPESAVRLAAANSWLRVVVTETEETFRHYLRTVQAGPTPPFPDNVRFTGPLPVAEYQAVLASVDGVLLCRDEGDFANSFNFPSKLIEALQLGVPLVCQHPISSVSPNLYCLIGSGEASVTSVGDYIARFSESAFLDSEREFLSLCSIDRLLSWVEG